MLCSDELIERPILAQQPFLLGRRLQNRSIICADTNFGYLTSVLPETALKKVKIVNPATLEPVATGEPGELLVSSTYMVSSYLNNPDETAEAFVELDGQKWYRTADIMSMDANGNLFFVDRTVDTIKHKGYRVSASEIESVLQEHPAVIAACAVGVPDKKVGERIQAYVVLREVSRAPPAMSLSNGAAGPWSPTKSPTTSSSGICCPNPKWASCCGGKSAARKSAGRKPDRSLLIF